MISTTNARRLSILSWAASAVIALSNAATHAATETQVIPFSHTEGNGFPTFSIDYFDTLGGSRTLTGVTIELAGTSTLEAFTENLGDQPINDWNFDFAVLPVLEILDFKKFAVPFDQADYPTVVLDLAASDGVEGSGPDFAHIPERMIDLADVVDIGPGDLALFTGTGSVDAFLGLPFLFPFPPGPTDTSWERSEAGTLTVTYTYVPEPTTMSLLSLGGISLVARRRQRAR